MNVLRRARHTLIHYTILVVFMLALPTYIRQNRTTAKNSYIQILLSHGKQDGIQTGTFSLKNGIECRCQCLRVICGEPLVLVGLPPLGPLTELCRPSEVREFCRCGITNFGGGCGVYCGGIELTDVCRVNDLLEGSSDLDGI